MTESLTIPELLSELCKLQQAYENDDITAAAFEAGAADLHKRITDRKLAQTMQQIAKVADRLKNEGKISHNFWVATISNIARSRTQAELNVINTQLLSLSS